MLRQTPTTVEVGAATTSASVVKMPASTSPCSMTRANTAAPKARPTPMPVNMACRARLCFPAPTFCDTKDAMDCIRALGISMAKLTILQATP